MTYLLALDQGTSALIQEIIFGRKPAFKHMLVTTLKVQNFHSAIIQPGQESPLDANSKAMRQTERSVTTGPLSGFSRP